ncbi:MAG: flagellar basal body L-ring protein FlgH [Candidatus Sedimenticola sp. (ex Thyasira tokunagai)]
MKVIVFLIILCGPTFIGIANGVTLFDESTYESLISDDHARKVGDIITILIFESASATANADSESEKSIDLGLSTNKDSNQHRFGIGVNNDYASGGAINRGGRLVANVSVTIEKILPNGEMHIEGSQELEFNDEKQMIKISGRIRPEDISADNTILSTRIADAKIDYIGDGVLGASDGPGIFTHIFNFLF